MIDLSAEEIAAAIGGTVLTEGGPGNPGRALIDSRQVRVGDLFFGLRGGSADGGEFAAAAIERGAWGVVVAPGRAEGLSGCWVFAVEDPLAALGRIAGAWRRALGAKTIGVTGSVGKTSVKDIAGSLIPGQVHASEENYNTEIGLPLTVLAAEPGTDVLVLEMAMRGAGQIAELAEIAQPDVAVITNVGPVHVELLGSVEAVAAAKAEVLEYLPPDGVAVVPADPGPLAPHLGSAPRLLRFGDGGDVTATGVEVGAEGMEVEVRTPVGDERFAFPFTEAYNLLNALAAIAAGVGIGASPAEMAARTADIGFSRLRGERIELDEQIVLVNDCYNANPVSMEAAIDHLASLDASRRFAVLGEMGELGPEAPGFHRRVGEQARAAGVDSLIGVGEAARDYAPDELVQTPADAAELLVAQLGPGDVVLIKGSRSAGLESVAEAVQELFAASGRGPA